MNFLFCSVGRRGELIKNCKMSLDRDSKIIATDNSSLAPALYFADKQYIVSKITDENYINILLDICVREKIKAVTTFIDPEIEILAKNREKFEEIGVLVLAPYLETARLCFDKYMMYEFMIKNGIKTIKTYKDLEDFYRAFKGGNCDFPVFVKPRTGSGSIGAMKVNDHSELEFVCSNNKDLVIQEFMDGIDLDADVYVDTISKNPVSIFSKKKIETKIGGANKTISFKDEKLNKIIIDVVSKLNFNGPIDIDFFYKDGEYYFSEINPRFGGAYLHAYGCGVDFIKLIVNNVNGLENIAEFGNYEEDQLMMMYDSVVIRKREELSK
nr:ATP-grasp domain-containing protein [uncultured Bacillus sp.]